MSVSGPAHDRMEWTDVDLWLFEIVEKAELSDLQGYLLQLRRILQVNGRLTIYLHYLGLRES